jgi:hypothetical protein
MAVQIGVTIEGYYVKNPRVDVGTKLLCTKETARDGLNDTLRVTEATLEWYQVLTPSHYSIIK